MVLGAAGDGGYGCAVVVCGWVCGWWVCGGFWLLGEVAIGCWVWWLLGFVIPVVVVVSGCGSVAPAVL